MVAIQFGIFYLIFKLGTQPSKISPNDHRDYPDIFEDWKAILKDSKQVNNFQKIQELLDRQKS